MIRKENDGTPEGELKSRICALIFLVQYIDESYGVFANADTISDLLVTDLTKGSDALRKQVPLLLEDLNVRGIISDVGNHVYHIQTKEGKVWDADYQMKFAHYKADDTKIMFERDKMFKSAIEQKIREVVWSRARARLPVRLNQQFLVRRNPRLDRMSRSGSGMDGKCRNP